MRKPSVVILAGGLATRMRPVTETIPKSMLLVAGEPFIAHQLRLLAQQGFQHVVLCLGHLGEQVEAYVGRGEAWGIQVEYSYDGEVLLGTGGALRRAVPLLGDNFFVMYGDSYLPIDFSAVWLAYQMAEQKGIMTVFHNKNSWDISNIIYRQGKIIRYDKREYTAAMEYIDYGLSILCKTVVEKIPAGVFWDLAEVYRDLVNAGQMAGYEVQQRFYEIGSPQGLAETCRYLETQCEK